MTAEEEQEFRRLRWEQESFTIATVVPTGDVYYLQCLVTKRIKIGYSVNYRRRHRQLSTAAPGKLVLLATEPGTMTTESNRHFEFSASHVKGEWFNPTPELLTHIKSLNTNESFDHKIEQARQRARRVA